RRGEPLTTAERTALYPPARLPRHRAAHGRASDLHRRGAPDPRLDRRRRRIRRPAPDQRAASAQRPARRRHDELPRCDGRRRDRPRLPRRDRDLRRRHDRRRSRRVRGDPLPRGVHRPPDDDAGPHALHEQEGCGQEMTRRTLLVFGGGVLAALVIGLFAIFGSEGQNLDYHPQNEFKLDPWISIHIGSLDLSINKAVLYLFLATVLTVSALVYIAKRMEGQPNRVQTAV